MARIKVVLPDILEPYIGLANPNALLLANAAFDAVMKIGWPEGRIPLSLANGLQAQISADFCR